MLILIEICPIHGHELHRDHVCDRCSNDEAAALFLEEQDPRGPYDEPDEDW